MITRVKQAVKPHTYEGKDRPPQTLITKYEDSPFCVFPIAVNSI